LEAALTEIGSGPDGAAAARVLARLESVLWTWNSARRATDAETPQTGFDDATDDELFDVLDGTFDVSGRP
jgi:hypothetical protein